MKERETYLHLYKFHIHTFIIIICDSYTHNAGYKRGDAREPWKRLINQSE